MDYEKILESLKICSEVGTSCDGCSGRGERHCVANLTKAAAIAIETLLHALDMARRERDAVTKRMVELEQEVCRLKSRLAAYEDTGLEPEEIYEVRFLIAAQRDPQKLARLRELVLADQDGRLVELPFVAMVEQSLQDGKMKPMGDQKHNGRYAVVYVDHNKWKSPLIDICGKPYNREEAENRMAALALKGGDG